jgi:hypothetical protein
MGIGLIGKDFNVQNKIPGWESNSIGYHSDDGNIFISKTTGELYGPIYTTGDVVGCCINFINKIVFFTKNGEFIKNVAFECEDEYELFPAIGMRNKKQSIQINFGEKSFYYNFKKYHDEVFDNLIDDILSIEKKQNHINSEELNYLNEKMDNLILDYLIYNGYNNTFEEIQKTKLKKFYTNEKIKERKLIFENIKKQNFIQAEKIIKNNFSQSEFSLNIINLITIIHKIIHNKEINTNLDLLLHLRTNIICSPGLKILKAKYPDFLFFDEFLNHITYYITSEKDFKIDLIKEIYEQHFKPEYIFEHINQNILQNEYNVYNSELDSIYKQTILTLRENLKLKNPIVNFLMCNKDFLERLNKKYFCNSIYYFD